MTSNRVAKNTEPVIEKSRTPIIKNGNEAQSSFISLYEDELDQSNQQIIIAAISAWQIVSKSSNSVDENETFEMKPTTGQESTHKIPKAQVFLF